MCPTQAKDLSPGARAKDPAEWHRAVGALSAPNPPQLVLACPLPEAGMHTARSSWAAHELLQTRLAELEMLQSHRACFHLFEHRGVAGCNNLEDLSLPLLLREPGSGRQSERGRVGGGVAARLPQLNSKTCCEVSCDEKHIFMFCGTLRRGSYFTSQQRSGLHQLHCRSAMLRPFPKATLVGYLAFEEAPSCSHKS